MIYLRSSNDYNTVNEIVFKISCFTRLYYNPNAPPGPSSERSEKFFAGIEV